ncbi:hypothetical protein LP420_13095 [Massilia sp. B-10]|nr:hypothetical protein LP420_13095 [Massilia sp. B-10]
MMENQDTIVTPGNQPDIRSVNVNRGVEWLVGGFRMFAKTPGPWLLAALALLIGSAVLSMFWLIGGALSTAFGVVFTGAMMRACQSLENGQEFASGLQAAGQLAAAVDPRRPGRRHELLHLPVVRRVWHRRAWCGHDEPAQQRMA